jgi:hypothetical protein
MIVIFDLGAGISDMIRNLNLYIYFSKKYNVKFSIRNATSRSLDVRYWSMYDYTNLFDEKMFENVESYISYHSIEKDISSENSCDFFKKNEIDKCLFKKEKSEYLNEKSNELIDLIQSSSNYKYIIIGACFSWWVNDSEKPTYSLEIIDEQILLKWKYNNNVETIPILPSEKIKNRYESFQNGINKNKYNFIHYRYEDDYNNIMKDQGLKYILPTVDDLIEHVPFKVRLPIYIATSNIASLHENKLMKHQLDSYTEIIYKKDCDDLNFDEAGFLDLLIGINAEEVYGVHFSGFTNDILKIKNTIHNHYDLLEIFQDEKYYKKI